ncbi:MULTISPECIES: translation initiation factor IF-2 N-terminal domain-containing protein [Mycobacteriaceae]|uniref:translation initiation factor IF-2 N-terminal domain-containing protein n=1 Tax=Mycobacteriaceae TaxID=1762 RepID=UPI000A064B1A
MKLNPPPRRKLRVHELARELGWTSRQLLAELNRRGEFVKSTASQLEAPVVRSLRREFGTVSTGQDPDTKLSQEMYGHSAEPATGEDGTSFADELARARAQSKTKGQNKVARWHPPILQALLDEVIVPHRPTHLAAPANGYFAWELKKAARLSMQWAEAQLSGLGDDESLTIRWIRLSDGQRPDIAAELASCGISPDEAALCIGHGGRIDPRLGTIYERFRGRKVASIGGYRASPRVARQTTGCLSVFDCTPATFGLQKRVNTADSGPRAVSSSTTSRAHGTRLRG